MTCPRPLLFPYSLRSFALLASLAFTMSCGGEGGTGPRPGYQLILTPSAITIEQGADGIVTIGINRTEFTSAVTLSLGNAPAGVTGSFNSAAPTGTSSTLTVSVGAAVAPGVYNLTVDGASAATDDQSRPLTLTVSPAPDYALSLNPVALTINQGANANTTVTLTRTNFTGAVTLSLGNAPAGVTGSFNPAAPTGTSSTLTVSVAAAVAPGVYNLTVDGTGTPGNRSTPLTLTVGAAPDYGLSLNPAALTINQGANANTAVTITRSNFTGPVTLSLGNAPAGVTASFNPGAPTGTSSTLTVSVGAAVAPGVYNLTVDGTGTPGNRSTPLTLTVTPAPDYALSLNPLALTINQGANANTTVTITRTNFTGAVTLSLGNVPAGVTGSFNPAAPTGTSSTLTVSVGAAVAPGVYNLTVDGAGTPGNRSTPLTLTVSPAPDYALSLNPVALAIAQGANDNTTVTITRTNFTGAVTLSLGNEPAGVTGSFNPAAPTGTSSTLTVTVGAAVAPGVYNLTVDGTGTPGNRSTPLTLTVNAASDFMSLTADVSFTCGLTSAGTAYCWGWNAYGQLGDGMVTGVQSTPVAVQGGHVFTALTAGGRHTCGLTSAGAAYCWGNNEYGQLGDGTITLRILTPVAVQGGLVFTELIAGAWHTCGLTSMGTAYCWGYNANGQLGVGDTTTRVTPVAVHQGGLAFSGLAHDGAVGFHTCGLTSTGAAYCWGGNHAGQLGDGTTVTSPPYGRLTPVAVQGGLVFTALTLGQSHTCGRTSAGTAYCWGANFAGRLGDGTQTDRLTPVAVQGGLVFTELRAGSSHTCGLTGTGAAYCWGWNSNGQLGDATTTQRLTPVAVQGGLAFTAVVVGSSHSCGLTSAGTAYCWGQNSSGELGDGTTTQRLIPVAVLPP